MKCSKCQDDFQEAQIHESHDVPCYLFLSSGNRKGRKNMADKFGRHNLCKICHDDYEEKLNQILRAYAIRFAKEYFKEAENGNTNTT